MTKMDTRVGKLALGLAAAPSVVAMPCFRLWGLFFREKTCAGHLSQWTCRCMGWLDTAFYAWPRRLFVRRSFHWELTLDSGSTSSSNWRASQKSSESIFAVSEKKYAICCWVETFPCWSREVR